MRNDEAEREERGQEGTWRGEQAEAAREESISPSSSSLPPCSVVSSPLLD
jgi:hypothetical protein